jgi:hypothetical protein
LSENQNKYGKEGWVIKNSGEMGKKMRNGKFKKEGHKQSLKCKRHVALFI